MSRSRVFPPNSRTSSIIIACLGLAQFYVNTFYSTSTTTTIKMFSSDRAIVQLIKHIDLDWWAYQNLRRFHSLFWFSFNESVTMKIWIRITNRCRVKMDVSASWLHVLHTYYRLLWKKERNERKTSAVEKYYEAYKNCRATHNKFNNTFC